MKTSTLGTLLLLWLGVWFFRKDDAVLGLQIDVRGLWPRRFDASVVGKSSSATSSSGEAPGSGSGGDDGNRQSAAARASTTTNVNRNRLSAIEDLRVSYSRSLHEHQSEGNRKNYVNNARQGEQVDRDSATTLWSSPSSSSTTISATTRNKKRKRKRQQHRLGKLIFIRCGQSEYNVNSTFSGWADPCLTAVGQQECEHAARLLLAEGYEIDVVYTSKLQRSIKSAWIILQQLDALFLPVYKTFRLNQRMYGSLQGLSKRTTAAQLGVDSVQAWRNSLKAKPPPLSRWDATHPVRDRRYDDLPRDVIPDAESLWDCQERARPLWQSSIRADLLAGKTVLVVAHKDSIKGCLLEIEHHLDHAQVQTLTIPKACPFVYRFDFDDNNNNNKHDKDVVRIKPRRPGDQDLSLGPATSGVFLEKPGRLKELLALQERWKNNVAFGGGVGASTSSLEQKCDKTRRVATLQESMRQLRMEQNIMHELEEQKEEKEETISVVGNQITENDDTTQEPAQGKEATMERWTDDPCEFEEYDEFVADNDEGESILPTVVPVPQTSNHRDTFASEDGPLVVLIRHGRTPHNNLGLFTGWEDPPLAEDGVDDARNAGKTLRRHGFEFDVVYTSWLTRAIQTAYYVLDELDSTWIPIVKSWRLNERMYGALTGKSKKMVANEYGEKQLKKWRRGYTIRPPPTSSYSMSYPGNDERRAKHFQDLPISWRESLFRSVEQRKLVLHRKFPKTESLKDCMDRSIPFYTKCIRGEAVNQGKRVLITSHENAIRGILMHLCDIPEEAMNQLHLPNGLPLVYNVKGRCVTLLDDGSGRDPRDVHDFGPAAKYLFKPCDTTDES